MNPTLDATKVLWVIPTIGSRFGGPTTTAVNGLIAEKRAGLDSELVSTKARSEPPGSIPAARRLTENRVKLRLFPRVGPADRGEAWGLSPRLAWWLMRNISNYDVVHLQYVWCMTSIVGAMVASLRGVPIVMTPHESLTDYDINVASRSRMKRRIKLLLRRFYLWSVDRLVFMSHLEKRDTRHGETSALIIFHAVQEKEVPVLAPSVANGAQGLRIAFLGRNIEKKGIDLIVSAIARHRDCDWILSIAGPPGTSDFIKETRELIGELKVDDRVHWLGFLKNRTSFLEESDVLVMPSAYEGFGMVAAEAMSVGVPVIVPKLSGVAELVSEFNTGVVMSESSVDALDDALCQLDKSPDKRREYGLNGITAANARLSYVAYASATGTLYRELLTTGKPGLTVCHRAHRT